MAGYGFNVCIIARNMDKIQEKIKEITTKFTTIKTRAVVADFSVISTIQEYKTAIADKV